MKRDVDNNSNLTKNIRYLLNSKTITANKLLEITEHNSTGLVAMWKSGERIMRTEDLIKLANYLNLTIDDLINKDLSNSDDISTITEVKDKINKLPNAEINEKGKETLINMVDTLHDLTKKE